MKADPRGVVAHLRRAVGEGDTDLADFLAGEIVAHLERYEAALGEIVDGAEYMCYSHYDNNHVEGRGCAVDIARRALAPAAPEAP